ncbi:diacylglycerol kinase [Chitinophaga sp. sic0106]|uniref:diacylglycerol kinase n=1 Tax=Chitinophaga sp. sic0106 TaxID=2854785 RepID=UPI001C437D76|nr:diacylglycerol kinase family protein [Chitinophaga sp. sic0106]MBV7533697.1 diacylglycerol kinase family protein [Chitinophaga sp. sic0106]
MPGSYFKNRLASFGYAFAGFFAFVKSEPHARIHAVSTVAVVAAGCWFQVSKPDWLWLLWSMALVWITEMLNTVIEKMMDHLSPAIHPKVKFIKDLAAAAVLVAAIAAAITGGCIFWPYLFS